MARWGVQGNWPQDPVIGPNPVVPLAFDPPTFIETPDCQRMPWGERPGWTPYTWRMFGVPAPFPQLGEVANTPAALELAEQQHRVTFPANHPERIRYWDRFRCIDIPPDALELGGTAWELTRVHLQKFGAGVVERVGTVFEDITALDDDGDPLFSFGVLDGLRPCVFPLLHPQPGVAPLSVEWRAIATEMPTSSTIQGSAMPPFIVAASPVVIPPDREVLQRWNDMRQGYAVRWADLLQYLTGENVIVRLIVILSGEPDRWRIRVGGRLSGFWNSAGARGVALDAATRRTF